MPRVAVVNVGVGAWYPKGQKRLLASLESVGFAGERILFGTGRAEVLPPGARPHSASAYEFKPYAMLAAKHKGIDIAIWADASMQAIRPLDPLVERIGEQGYWFCTMGWTVGQWCTDAALPKLGITRDQGFGMTMIASGLYGLDFRSRIGNEILDWALDKAREGAYSGPWYRKDGFVSTDNRVLGHRHDQTVLSVIIAKKGLKVDYAPCFMAYDKPTDRQNPKTLVVCCGM